MLNSVPSAATFSKDKIFFGKNFPIQYITDSKGAYIKGNNGKWYLDWISGLGANLLGYYDRYANYGFYHYVSMKMLNGLAYSLPHELEYLSAQKLINLLRDNIPYWNDKELQVKWTLSGSDACNAAIRLAKARKKGEIWSFGYHGWADQFIAATPPAHGLYDISSVKNFEFNAFPKTDKKVSAVIIEVPPVVENVKYFTNLKKWCVDHDALLIVDEVVTGLRYARGGASELFNIEPDIICMGKSLGNGMPTGAVIASIELMNWFNPRIRENHDPVFVSSTNVGNLGSLAAISYILDYVKDGEYLKHISQIGFMLKNELTRLGYNVIGNAARNLILWKDDTHKSFTITYFVNNGILLNRPNFTNMAHNIDDVEKTIKIAENAINEYGNLSKSELDYWKSIAPITLFRNR